MDIETYNKKRDFQKTSEPKGKTEKTQGNKFVVQEHFASHHHFDFRLELEGVLKSWAVPKGPSLNPKDKRLAVHVEDHPLEYGNFEGVIPKGEYGGGKVILWDTGLWIVKGDASKAYRAGKLEFELKGKKLKGRWTLVKTNMGNSGKENWLLMKKSDEFSSAETDIVHERQESVKEQGNSLEEPFTTSPQLATLKTTVPESDDYIHELKYDGYRTIARIHDGRAWLYTRNLKDWTRRYPLLARSLMSEKLHDAILDGEVVWLDEDGLSSFEGLQKALKSGEEAHLYYYVFDILRWKGKDVRDKNQEERKKLAKKAVEELGEDRIRYSQHFAGQGSQFYEQCCEMGAEGVISKKKSANYGSGRNENWLKIKCENQDEFAIIGFQQRKSVNDEIGSLALGLYGPEGLQEVGKVGTGFDKRQRKELFKKLSKHSRKTPPAKTEIKDKAMNWVTPKLVAQIKYTEFTKTGKLRHPVYVELRDDKNPKEACFPNKISSTPKTSITHEESFEKSELEELITSPQKALWTKPKTTKLELAQYYNEVYPFMRDHLQNKILNLLKCPKGVTGGCFYNKHAGNMKNLKPVEVTHKGKTEEYFSVEDLKGLIRLVRYNTLEIHTWNARAGSERVPDEVIFDLDPSEGLSSKKVLDGAFELKETLQMLGLESYPKITGGKGVHLHVPLAPEHTTEQVYQFAKSIAYILEQEAPTRYTSNSRFSERVGKIFVDYLRNSFGATYICPFSTRAKEGAPLSLPISWKELKGHDLNDPITLRRFLKLKSGTYRHPWQGYWENLQLIDVFH